MLNALKLWNYSAGTLPAQSLSGNTFVLKTCQRTLVLACDQTNLTDAAHLIGIDAYIFLLETICGLQSKLIGENEIVGQFKEAYQIYAASTFKDTKLLRILEKLFKDAKEIRTQYLIGISQKTYASLTRKHLIQKAHASHIVIVGSGALAEDLINQFKKKATISICARNEERLTELARQHQFNIIPWEQRHTLVNEPFIANTIGTDNVLFDEAFFASWLERNAQRLFVDLGSPSAIKTPLSLDEGVVRLNDIFNEGAIVEGQKHQQISLAKEAMTVIAQKRVVLFQQRQFSYT